MDYTIERVMDIFEVAGLFCLNDRNKMFGINYDKRGNSFLSEMTMILIVKN